MDQQLAHESGLSDDELAELTRLVLTELKSCMTKKFGRTDRWTCDVREAVAKACMALGIGVHHDHVSSHTADQDAARMLAFRMIMTMVGNALDIDFLALSSVDVAMGLRDKQTVH